MKIVLVTGGFDPIHSGHIKYLEEAKQLGDKLVVGLNSDKWLTKKKGRPFLNIEERIVILMAIKQVDSVIRFNDDDYTSIKAIEGVKKMNPNDTIIFANGGDRKPGSVPEYKACEALGIEMAFSVGGDDKPQSSSWLVEKLQKTKKE